MARKPSPWYWPERRGWYTILNGHRHHLVDLAADSPTPKKRNGKWIASPDIEKAFHALLATPPQSVAAGTSDQSPLVAAIFDKFLDWSRQERAPRTFDWYRDHIQGFLDSLGPAARTLTVSELKPFHVMEWIGKHIDPKEDGVAAWSPTYRRGAIIAIQRPFNWAEELGYIALNPIKKIKKPQAARRDNPMTSHDFDRLLAMVREGDPFRDLFLFCWHTGCRPQEARGIEARHVNLPASALSSRKKKLKGKNALESSTFTASLSISSGAGWGRDRMVDCS
jgi:integrase